MERGGLITNLNMRNHDIEDLGHIYLFGIIEDINDIHVSVLYYNNHATEPWFSTGNLFYQKENYKGYNVLTIKDPFCRSPKPYFYLVKVKDLL